MANNSGFAAKIVGRLEEKQSDDKNGVLKGGIVVLLTSGRSTVKGVGSRDGGTRR